MPFQAYPLSQNTFAPLFALNDAELAAHNAVRVIADAKPGFPCRVSLEDAEPGETLILVNYEHQPAAGPYRASHAVYVREGVGPANLAVDALPPYFAGRTLSLRAFDKGGMIVGAELVEGEHARPAIEALLADPATA